VGRATTGVLEADPALAQRDADGPTDLALVAAVRRGDDRAFEVLYSRYLRRIQAYVLGMCKDHQRAEDITQEVFVSALRRMRATERPIAFKPWIYEIAKNACIDQFRRARRTDEVSLQADDGPAPADLGPTPEAAVGVKQDLDNLCGAFGGLSDVHHEILVMRELEGFSYREIGERLGMSRPAVESTLFRARRRLSEEYDELVSGERCLRIQGVIATAAQSRLGARDARRLSHHVAHCQGCRRDAYAAGLDPATLRRPLRTRIAAKVAGLLPFPILGRRGAQRTDATLAPGRLDGAAGGWLGHLAGMSDQLGAGWGKAAAAAAILLAGLGAGAGTRAVAGGSHGHPGAPAAVAAAAQRTPAETDGAAASTVLATAKAPATGRAPRAAKVTAARTGRGASTGTRTSAVSRGHAGAPASSGSGRSGGGNAGGAAPAAGTGASGSDRAGTVAVAPAATRTPSTDRLAGGVRRVVSGVAGSSPATASVPSLAAGTTSAATGVVNQVADTTTQVTQQAVAGATDAIDDATAGATAPVTSRIRDTTAEIGSAVQRATGTTGPVHGAADAVGGLLPGGH
jgi:RNA polymerase sigma factor (sigma-70 family)